MDDLTARPLLDSVVISATGEIERRRERFSARSLVAWQELDPLRNPLPSEPKKGWTYNVLVHVDTLEDLHTRKARAYKWDYEVQDDGIRFKEYPLPCRAEPDLARGPTMTMMIERTTPKAVIEAVHSGTGSVAALPVGIVSQTGAMASAATRKEGEDRETRNDHTPVSPLSSSTPASASPCKLPTTLHNPSPDGDAAAVLIVTSASAQTTHQADSLLSLQGREDVLEILESHLDPMLHEAAVNHSMYSPDTNSPRVSFPVFVTSFARPASAPTLTPLAAAKDSQITEFINDIATSIQPPLLPAPDVNVRKPSRVKVKIPVIASAQRHSERLLYKRRANAKFENFTQEILSKKFGIMNDSASFDDNVKKLYLQRYKKPLSPASLKTIADLVEKGGCKAIRLKASKKASVAPLWLTLAD
ncbi:hypothetical protein OsI_23593 [Oryza sativa Indica Group]|uniref:Uncharacterized protein n=1 Tax=Oryza sativa subsp. indica TaxID=39946 RepID=A2YEQ1_ORYSI|nr:hypothetical protein OsI_23593 [Oryza sativa Indica Group]